MLFGIRGYNIFMYDHVPRISYVHCSPRTYPGERAHILKGVQCWCRPKLCPEVPNTVYHSPEELEPMQLLFDKVVNDERHRYRF